MPAVPEGARALIWYSSIVSNVHALRNHAGNPIFVVDKVVQRQRRMGNRTAVRSPRTLGINRTRVTTPRRDMETPNVRRIPTTQIGRAHV